MAATSSPLTPAPLNVLDELYLHLNRPEEPWSVHLEIRVEGHVDRRRLEEAVQTAAGRHPLTRARLAPTRRQRSHFRCALAKQ
jgi:hypothetical protein